MALIRILNEPLEEAPFTPTVSQRRWMRERMLEPKEESDIVATRAHVHLDRVKVWFLDAAFVRWVEAIEKMAEPFWIHEARLTRRNRALGGDFRQLQAYLEQNDPEVIKRQIATATTAVGAQALNFRIAVALVDPRDPKVLERQGEIHDAQVIEVNASSPSAEDELLEAVPAASERQLPSTAASEPAGDPEV